MSSTAAFASQTTERNIYVARIVLFVFLLTFIVARMSAFLIMARWVPDLYLHLGGNHIHHLNYGIFLLAGLGGYLLFTDVSRRNVKAAAIFYGIGMALTFDEFGMWVRLGGSYWQRASVDAIAVLAAVFGLIAYAPSLKRFRPRHWWSAVLVTVFVTAFFVMLNHSFDHVGKVIGPKLYELEAGSPP